MNADESKKTIQPPDAPCPPEKPKRSGEGAATALQALIRKRRQVEGHDEPAPPDTQSPPP
jgi:hypothetical protein